MDIRQILHRATDEAFGRGNRVFRIPTRIAKRLSADRHSTVSAVVNDGGQYGGTLLVEDHLCGAADHARHKRVRCTQVNADRKTMFMRRCGEAGFCYLK